MLGIAQCISWGILFYAFSVLLPPMASNLALSHSALSFMATLSALVAAGVAVPLGRRLDGGGHLRMMMLGSLLGALGCAVWSWSSTTLGLYSASILIGLAQASTLYEPVFAFLLYAFPAEKERNPAMMQVTLIGGLASTVFLPLTTFLIQILGWRGALQALAFFLLIPVGIYYYWEGKRKPDALHGPVKSSGPRLRFEWNVFPSEAKKMLMILLPVFLINAIVHTSLTTHLPSALQSWGFGAYAASWAVGVMGAMQLLGRLGLGQYLGFLKHGPLLLVPLTLIALALVLLTLTSHLSATWILLGLIGASSGLLTLLRPTVVSRLFDIKIFGRVNGILALSYQLARAGGPIGGSWIYEATGSYRPLFWALSIMLFLAASLSYLLKRQPASS
jgi:predicted MFS family arabinose efflux permease